MAGTWLAGLLLLGVALTDLVLGPPYMRRVRARIASGDVDARVRMYRLTILLAWCAAAAALGTLLGAGLSWADIGLTWPDLSHLGDAAGWLGGVLFGLAVGGLAATVAAARGQSPPTIGDIDVLLPRGPRQRRWFALVAVTAGLTEEVFYRALAILFLLEVLPASSDWAAVGLAAVVFALGHAYQGVAGVLVTGVLGLVLGATFVLTGSLLPGMVLHMLIDLRALLVRPAPDEVFAHGQA